MILAGFDGGWKAEGRQGQIEGTPSETSELIAVFLGSWTICRKKPGCAAPPKILQHGKDILI